MKISIVTKKMFLVFFLISLSYSLKLMNNVQSYNQIQTQTQNPVGLNNNVEFNTESSNGSNLSNVSQFNTNNMGSTPPPNLNQVLPEIASSSQFASNNRMYI